MLFSKQASSLIRFKHYFKESRLCLSYVQGQSPEPKIREYFYFIDHEGMVSFLEIKTIHKINDSPLLHN